MLMSMVFPLNFIHGHIHLSEEFFNVLSIKAGASHGSREVKAFVRSFVKLRNVILNYFNLCLTFLIAAVGEYYNKFIAAHAHGNGISKHGAREYPSHRTNGTIAHRMTMNIVDEL